STLATRQTQDALHSFDISAQPEQKTVELSGGNIQKLAIARLFSIQLPKLLILCEPTWGLDIKSTENVRRRILDAKAAGSAILILSSDVDEILALADSIMVLYRGRAVLLASNSGELNRERIGEYLLGARSE
ncbi:MAG: ABC transporter ATP-binding protein, partial [Spirochaetota bacterium]